nr:hypothetical protein [Candidatus Sigynarchaeota archaeon]
MLMTGNVSPAAPIWYKITVPSQNTLNLQVNATNLTNPTILGVALTLGIAANFGDTVAEVTAVINSTQNATLAFNQTNEFPLYLTIFFINDSANASVGYQFNCSYPIVNYSYGEYYRDVVYPDVIMKVIALAGMLGSIVVILTIILVKRSRNERRARQQAK